MSATQPNGSPLQSAAENLLSLGYRIVPIMPRQKAPGEFVGGRWKAMDGWPRYKSTAPTKWELGMWGKWPDANIGVVLGSPVGDGLVVIAIDLDLRDPDELRAVMGQLPPTPMSKAGAKGETLFFRASPEFKSRAFKRPTGEIDEKTGRPKTEGIADLLTGNATKQTVVPPSRHPDGFDYRWLRGPVAARDLPIFGPGAMERFEEALRALGWEASGASSAPAGLVRARQATSAPASTQGSGSTDETVFSELNRRALNNLAAWVPELGLFNCRPARGGFEAVATWRSSSTGRPDSERKRNLSIQSSGIKDFGTETTYSPIDLVMNANGGGFGDAYQWLSMILDPVDETGVVITFDPTKRQGATPPAKIGDPATELEANDTLPPVVRLPDMAPAFFDTDIDLVEWAEPDCFPNGLVGKVAKWICDTAIEPTPILAYGAALALVGTAAGRQFQGPTGTGTHLYIIGAAATGVGKDHPMQAVMTALNDAGMGNLVGPSDFTADSAVLRHLQDKPLSVCLMDEFGSFWKRISGRRAGNWEAAITRALREPWGRSFGAMRTKQYAGIGPASEDIWWPAMSILGMTTPGEFFGALTGSDVENGMANRLLVLTTQRRIADKRSRDEIKAAYFGAKATTLVTPDAIRLGLASIRDWQGQLIGQQIAWSSNQRPAMPVVQAGIRDDAADVLFSYRQWILWRAADDEAFGKFYSRGAEMAQRIALIHAVGEAAVYKVDPKITLEHVTAAIRLVDWSLRTLWARVADHQAPEGLREVVQAVFKALDRRGGKKVPRTDLRQGLHGAAKRDLQDAIEELEESGVIKVERERAANAKKPTEFYSILMRPKWAS